MQICRFGFDFFSSTMGTICLQCGDRGFTNAFVYCVKCLNFAVHRYCLDAIPSTFDEFVLWVCDVCNSKHAEQSALLTCNFNPWIKGEQALDTAQDQREICGVVRKKKKTKKKTHKMKVKQGHGIGSSKALEESKGPSGTDDGHASHSTQDQREECGIVKNNKHQTKKMKQGHGIDSFQGLEGNIREEASASQCTGIVHKDFQNIMSNESNMQILGQPVINPIWRGGFSIWNKDAAMLNGIWAHVSNKACRKVYEETIILPAVLHLEILPKSTIWPEQFRISQPSDENIALYFFSSEISESVFDLLVDGMMRKDLALRFFAPNAELLIFSSLELPLLHWTLNGKNYLWGVFKGHNRPQSHFLACEKGSGPAIHSELSNDTRSPISH